MAFFDDLGKKITGMTDVAKINSAISDENNKIQRNITELGKLYYATYAEDCAPEFLPLVKAIQESEKKIAEYKRQKQDIKGIVRCTKCSAEIPANSVFCSVCGTPAPVQAPAGTPYAPSAPAAPVAPSAPAGQVICPACGKSVDGKMKFCTQCGAPMNQQPVAPAAPVIPEPVAPAAPAIPEPVAPAAPVIPEPVAPVAPVIPEPVVPVAPVIPEPVAPVVPVIPQPVAPEVSEVPAFCTNCGTPIESGMAFCTNCGAKV